MKKTYNKSEEFRCRGTLIEVYNNDVNKALRKLKKRMTDENVVQDIRKNEFYQSKGTKRRLSKLAAIRRHRKNIAKEQDQ